MPLSEIFSALSFVQKSMTWGQKLWAARAHRVLILIGPPLPITPGWDADRCLAIPVTVINNGPLTGFRGDWALRVETSDGSFPLYAITPDRYNDAKFCKKLKPKANVATVLRFNFGSAIERDTIFRKHRLRLTVTDLSGKTHDAFVPKPS